MQTKGYVTYVGSKIFGKRELFSFRINSEDKFFSTGTSNPKIEKNDYIEFDYVNDGKYNNVDVSSIKHIAREESGTTSDTGKATEPVRQGAKGGGNSNGYWEERFNRDVENDAYRKANDLRIQYQSARNAAISVVDVLLRERVLKLAESAKADNVAVVLGKIHDLTDEFFSKCSEIPVSSDTGDGADDLRIPHNPEGSW